VADAVAKSGAQKHVVAKKQREQ